MPSYGSKRIVWSFLLAAAASLSLLACTPTKRMVPPPASPVRLQDPTTTHTDSATLTVGTNRWRNSAAILEEAFLPLAVTMRNNSSRPLCGGVQTAALHATDGSSISAVVPTTVVERLFGPIASLEPEGPLWTVSTPLHEQSPFLLLVHGPHGGHSFGGGMHSGGPSPFAPRPFSAPFSSPFSSPHASPFSAPYASPFHAPFSHPHSSPFHSPYSSFAYPYASPFYSPYVSPFYSPFSPYSADPFSPFSRYSPYDYGYAVPPLPPHPPATEPEQPKIDQSLIREIFSAAFVSRPLAPQEERTGFLFFPRPAATDHTLTLSWSWYDCVSHELIANLSVPIATPRP